MQTDHIYNARESIILFIASIICIASFIAYSVLYYINYSVASYKILFNKTTIMHDNDIITYFCFISLIIIMFFVLKGLWKCRKTKAVFFIFFSIIIFFSIYINNPLINYLYMHKIVSGKIFLWNGFNFIGIAAVASFTFSVLLDNNIYRYSFHTNKTPKKQ